MNIKTKNAYNLILYSSKNENKRLNFFTAFKNNLPLRLPRYVTPCMRAYMINCGCLQKFWGNCVQCFVQPLCEAIGHCLSNIRMTKS